MTAEAEWHPKREAKRFEPPPWERERFDALRQAREEQLAAESAAAEAMRESHQAPAEEDRPEPARAAEAAAEFTADLAAVRDEAAEHEAAHEAAEARPPERKAATVPEAQVDAMLIRLGAEEPRVDEHLKVVGVFGSAVSMFFGLCMLAWGLYMFATARGKMVALIGAMIVFGMGLFLGAMGFWFGWRVTNRGE